MNILICGSRKCNQELIALAQFTVAKCKEKGYSVTVGDAEGIDYFTMLECHHLGVPHIVYGINGKLRHKTKTCSMNTVCENYLERDRLMVLTADKCIALCYGRSRGTLYTYNYAVKQGKPARLIERF